MSKLLGYGFLILGVGLLVLGVNQLGIYIKNPDIFPIYHMLINLPEADRTISLQQGSMVLSMLALKHRGMLALCARK